tara:strand:+ start:4119 stop:7025 length:2907 start_codon:yes stop_codon:yes gene_type:complete
MGISVVLSPVSLGVTLQQLFEESDKLLLNSEERVEHFGSYPNYILDTSTSGEVTISNGDLYSLLPVVTVNIEATSNSVSIPVNGFASTSYEYVDVYDTEYRDKWGDSVIDQLISAHTQGLIPQYYTFEVTNVTSTISISNLVDNDSSYSADVSIVHLQSLVIPQFIVDDIAGGWEGDSLPTIEHETFGNNTNIIPISSSKVTEMGTFTDSQWTLPLLDNIAFYYDENELLTAITDLSGDITNGVGITKVQNLPFSISQTNEEIILFQGEYRYVYFPFAHTSDDWETIVEVYSGNELIYMYVEMLVELQENTANFSKHITTQFPFVQGNFINGRSVSSYDETGLLKCNYTFAYRFSTEGALERGIFCDEDADTINIGDSRWTWYLTDDGKVVHSFEDPDSYFVARTRYWDPISTNEEGFTRVLEYSYAEIDNNLDGEIDESGFLIRPRINIVKLQDLSKYETEYTASGFQGDNDSDGINDSQDDDDDNDGMSDVFENSYSLNHLDGSDASNDEDFDGLSNLQEFSLGTDPSLMDTDGDGVSDGRDIDPLDPLVSADSKVLAAEFFGDINGDYYWDWYMATQFNDGYELVIYSGKDNEVLQTLSWNQEYTNAEIVQLDDMNGDGVAELGLFGFVDFVGENENLKKPQLYVLDPVSGERVVVHNWPGNWSDISFILLPDANGDGILDVAIQGKFKDGGRPQLYVKDAITGDKLALHAYPAIYSNTNFGWHSDFNGDGVRDISMIGQKSNGKIQVRISSGSNGQKLGSYNFPANYSDISWLYAGDINDDGNNDYGLLGKRLDDGRVQFFTKSGVSQSGSLGIYSWPDLTNFNLFRVRDLTGDDAQEFALVGFRESANRYQMIVKDGRDRNSTITSTGWANNWDEVSFEFLGNIDGDESGSTEIALFGRKKTNGNWQMNIRSSTGEFVGLLELGSEWDSKPGFHHIILSDSQVIFLYGEANGESTTKSVNFDF